MKSWILSLCALLLAGAAQSRDWPVELQGPGPYYRLSLPLALRSELRGGALQVRNEQGQVLAHARVETPPLEARPPPRGQNLRLFAQPAGPQQGKAPREAPAWLLDAGALKAGDERLRTLHFEWIEAGVFRLQLEASPDLQHWRPLSGEPTLVSLQHQGQTLRRSRLDLDEAPMRYLRVRARPGSALPTLTAVQAEWQPATRYEAAPLEWSEPLSAESCAERHCDYALPPGLSLERVELLLTQPNALDQVTLYGLGEAQAAAPDRPHGLREHVRRLKPQRPPQTPAEPGWIALSEASIHWLQLPEGEWRQQQFDAGLSGPWKKLRLQSRGPIAQWGPAPRIRVGLAAQELVFLASGAASPRGLYSLRPAPANQDSRQTSLAQLLPPGPMPHQDRARVVATPMASAAPASAPPAAAPKPEPSPRRYGLWAVLAFGVLLMAGMAWSLLKPARA